MAMKSGYSGGKMKGNMMMGMKDGSRNAMPNMTMGGQITPGMTPAMNRTMTQKSGNMMMQGQGERKGSMTMPMGDSARGRYR